MQPRLCHPFLFASLIGSLTQSRRDARTPELKEKDSKLFVPFDVGVLASSRLCVKSK